MKTKVKTLKTSETLSCSSIEDARVKNDMISNGVIVSKNNLYSIVNYKTYTELKSLGYIQVR